MTPTWGKAWRVGLVLLALIVVAAGIAVSWINSRGEDAIETGRRAARDPVTIERGAYLARAGNCMGCHTARGGGAYAGGRGIETPFGTIYAPNLTSDRATGIGAWSPSEFWRAMHHGRSKDGRLLYPAFPYPNYTLVTRDDSDALFAFLQNLPATSRKNQPHDLRFPYNLQASVAVWRALYFRPALFEPDATQSAEWNRGSYLVRGLGHCIACHSSRNLLGASTGIELGGGLIPMQNWYAPSLASPREAGVSDWQTGEIVALLKNGVSTRASVMGPMAEVVFRSTQYLSDDDLRAMAVFLKTLRSREAAPAAVVSVGANDIGAKLYADHCASCHGDRGQGVAGMYPSLAGNRAVTLAAPNNVVKAILHGGFAPATRGNPRPFGMPPFEQTLSEAEVAAVATHVRQAWGNVAPAVSTLDVHRGR